MKSKLLLLVIAIILITFPKFSFGQVISLGPAASQFVLFTSSGAVGDNAVSPSHITGDVGTNTAGPITGFGNVNGVMHPGADLVTAAVDIDLLATIAQLNANPATLFPSATMGSGEVYTPGIYSIPGNATLTLDLILDGQGDPNAEFVIKIQGTLGTNTNSKVKLINGALACHVYWQIDGAVTMASLSTMRGNMISGGAIIMGSGDSLEGRAFSTVGLIGIDGITAFTPIGCGSPVLTGPPLPNLGSAICYTIFSSNGALDGNLSTTSIGDVGNNGGGTITGWNAGNVTGTLHLVQDPSTIQCAIDVLNLYNTLNAMTPDIELLYPAQFGNNLVLTPHVYLMKGAATFTDSLYLDAQGNSSAVFVIKITNSGAITTSTYSKVKLINGALAENVFWMVDGAVSVNNYSEFKGTVVVSAGAINMVNTGVVLNGRILTVNGAVTTDGLAAFMSPGCNTNTPLIITEPVSQTVCEGSSVSFTVTATVAGLTYQWRKGTVNLIDGGNISGALTSTLTINPATSADAALNYNVIVYGTFPNSDTSVNVSLTIDTAPFITNEPVSQSACIGGSASFTVVATGTALTYQWRKGSVNIMGATNATYTINPVTLLDAANNYNVVIIGTCPPSDTSINVSLIVDTATLIITEPVNQTACEGSSVSFSVIANGTLLTYQWRKGTVNIMGATNSTYTINPVTFLDAALNYNVIVGGTCGANDTSINVSLEVDTATLIITEPMNQSACVGNSVSFSVIANGTLLTYQWRKGSVNIIGATNATYTINPVTLLDAGNNYNVVVIGTCPPSDTSIYVSLEVDTATLIITEPINQTVCLGSSVSFSVFADGTDLTYQWRKGTVNIVGATNSTYTINPVTLLDAALNYNVVVAGSCGANDTSINVSLIINTAPDITTEPIDQTVCSGSSVSFSVMANGSGLTYQWRKGSVNIVGATNSIYTINPVNISDAALNYNVVITGTCLPNDTSIDVSLTVNQTPVAVATSNTPVCADSTIILTTPTVLGATYLWTNVNGYSSTLQNPVITSAALADSGIYSLTVSVNGCTSAPSYTTVVIYSCDVTDFFIPEGFSPNADGINDLFVIRGIFNFSDNTFLIYNRWGDKVFDAKPYLNNWDGRATYGLRIGGDELPIGTYFYILDLGNGSEVYKGTIYLNR